MRLPPFTLAALSVVSILVLSLPDDGLISRETSRGRIVPRFHEKLMVAHDVPRFFPCDRSIPTESWRYNRNRSLRSARSASDALVIVIESSRQRACLDLSAEPFSFVWGAIPDWDGVSMLRFTGIAEDRSRFTYEMSIDDLSYRPAGPRTEIRTP